jgi:DNA invertase Pin-like site-specific DNA recombinase
MRLAYLRREDGHEHIDRTIATLEAARCDRIVFDSTPPGRREASESLSAFLARMQPGDTLIVPHLGQLSRSSERLIGRLADLFERGIAVESLAGELDTADPATARCIIALHDLTTRLRGDRERPHTRPTAGLGRPRRLTPEDLAGARRLIESEGRPVAEVARQFGVSRATLYRALKGA